MRRSRFKIEASGLLLAIIVIFFATGVAAAVFALQSDAVAEASARDGVISVLYVIEKDDKPLSSFVLMYYPLTRRAAIFDIPSETGLLLAGVNQVNRIDSIYNPQRLSAFENEVERLLGINLSFSVVMTLENLGKLVDLLGGVEVFIPAPVNIVNESQTILFPSGMVLLDGDKASLFASFELPEEEREQIMLRRQRFFLSFLRRQGEMNEMLRNRDVARLYHSFLRTDMSARTRMRLFDEFSQINTDRIAVQAVGGNFRVVQDQMLLIPHWDGTLVRQIVRQAQGMLTRQVEGALTERTLTVEVLNGTTVTGLAARTADLLRSFGYDVIATGNAYRNNIEQTEIIDRYIDAEMGRAFADIIRGNNIRRQPLAEGVPEEVEFGLQEFNYRADFTLILGRDFNGRFVVGN
ncbi:MAG: LCP family protein [Spirochaetes bacterium]|nr:LCP family protein [Spirochaetota bacterium]